MRRLSQVVVSALWMLSVQASSAVMDLLPKNFDEVVLQSGKPALVEFFAPWCGHCRNLVPVYEELAQTFAFASDKISIAKVDADAHKTLGRRFGIQGFPTIKWFNGKSDKPEHYEGGRDIESLTAFVAEKSGVSPRTKKALPSNVEILDDQSFKKQVGGDQNVLVAFTAPWCGHCKSLAPIWETLANDFSSEPTVLIAKVDAEAPNAKATAEEQGVKSFPTIKFFAAGSTTAVLYEGKRSEADFVSYLNEQAGTHRTVGGALDSTAGTIAALDGAIAKITSGDGIAAVAKEVQKVAKDLKDTGVEYYLKVLAKLEANEGYVDKELARIQGLIKNGGLAPAKLDELTIRRNILGKFASGNADKEDGKARKDEL